VVGAERVGLLLDHVLAELAVLLVVEGVQDVAGGLGEDVEGDGAVVHLERRLVVVDEGQVRAGVDLEGVVVAVVVEVVADGGH